MNTTNAAQSRPVPADSSGGGALTRISDWTESHPIVAMAIATAWYVLLVWKFVRRPLWYDELYTFYIAGQPSWGRMMEAIRDVDLNPPLNYVLTRCSLAVLGDSPLSVRVPEIVLFWTAGAAVFILLRRRTNAVYGAIGVLLLWSSPFFLYAAEARPYAPLLAFTAFLLLGWEYAISGRRTAGLLAVWIAGSCLLLSHVLGVLPLGAIWVGETIRSWKRRKIDAVLALALLLPLAATVTYKPMLHAYSQGVFSWEAQASFAKVFYVYFAVLRWMWRPLLALGAIVWLCVRRSKQPLPANEPAVRDGMGTALGLLFLVPLGINLLFMRSHGAFYDRYAIVSALAIALGCPLLLARYTRREKRWAAGALATVVLCLVLQTSAGLLVKSCSKIMPEKVATKLVNVVAPIGSSPFRPWWRKQPLPDYLQAEKAHAPILKSLERTPQLPIVAASELTFLEMDSREPVGVVERLYYLMDREAALQITHRSFSDEMLLLKHYFPIRGTAERYQDFAGSHRQFLVLGTYEYPGDWLLKKLEQDGATLRLAGEYSGYKDTDLYEVTLAAPGSAPVP